MFEALAVLVIRSRRIARVELPSGEVSTLLDGTGRAPDGVVVSGDRLYWTTMGVPRRDPVAEDGLDFSERNGGLHGARLDGTDRHEILPTGALTTGKQLAIAGDTLYWGDREGCRVSRVRVDGGGHEDVVVNPPGVDGWCVGVAVHDGHVYWTQKGRPDGGIGRILRAPLGRPDAASRDGVEVLWDGLPEPIDLDIVGDTVYWTDRGAPPAGNTLNRAPIPPPAEAGAAPEILADGFTEAIGLAIDAEAGVAYVGDMGGTLRAVSLGAERSDRVIAEFGEPITGIAGIPGGWPGPASITHDDEETT